ncbi:unnamed protein product [Brassica oleracea var. botrytis]
MLKRFRSKPPQGSRLLRDITTFSAATSSVHRRSHLQLSSYPPLRISYGKTNPELQLLSHCNGLTVVHGRTYQVCPYLHCCLINYRYHYGGCATNKLSLVFI